ncbi:MAG: hypothetical protein JO199_11610 [Candidatus Eremiobacteraeota bacterium]|nr:hypothetical protein [Candidatus Eremiobacteraeota bacterium]
MKRTIVIVVVVLLIFCGGFVAWKLVHRNPADAAFKELIPTGPIACPENAGDLSGIEGWAPGAGKAGQTGQTNAQNLGALGGGLAGESSTAAPSPSGGCTGLAAPMVARFAQIQSNLHFIPTDGFDPQARADEINDAGAAFAFVRDRIATDAYPGAMRGPGGTLQARAGSPSDKALLLAALLSAKGVQVRYAHVALTDDQVAQAISAATAPAPSPSPADVSQAFKTLGIDPNAARDAAQSLARRTNGAIDRVIADASSPTDALIATLASSKSSLATDDSAVRAGWKTALADHWWVEAFTNGAWVDLDPTLPNATPGSHLGAPPTDQPAETLPDTQQVTLTVSLVATRMTPGSPSPSPSPSGSPAPPEMLATHAFKVADVYAQPIVVTIGNRSAGSTGISESTTFTPSIDGAGSETNGDPFNVDNLATVELDIDVAQPGAATPLHYRRVVVDRRTADKSALDPAWTPERTAYALTGVYDLLPLPGDLDPGFAGYREGDGLKMVQAFMAYTAAGGNGTQMPPPGSETYPMQALHYYEYDTLVRQRLEDAGKGNVRFYFNRPLLAIEHRGFDLVGTTPNGVAQFDVVENGMAASGAQPQAAIRANFTRGYVDEYTEQHMTSAPNDGGTIEVFAQAKRDNVALQVLNGPQYGGVAIAPVKPVTMNGLMRTGWWQVDPSTGNLIGRMGPAGAGQELVEYAIARANDWSSLYSMIQFYGDFFRCIAGAVEAPLGGVASTKLGFANCAMAAICSYLDGVGSGYVLGDRGFTDIEMLIYNILDLSAGNSKSSWPPTGGAACGAMFKSPLYP